MNLTVATPDLELGDIVLTHGMRVLLDREAVVFGPYGHPGETADPGYAWVGLVTNVDDVREAGVVPLSWLTHDGIGQPFDGEHRWNVQGNRFATWQIERGEG